MFAVLVSIAYILQIDLVLVGLVGLVLLVVHLVFVYLVVSSFLFVFSLRQYAQPPLKLRFLLLLLLHYCRHFLGLGARCGRMVVVSSA